MPDRTQPIAVFDSGVGGLTVLHDLLVRLPHEDFLYLGDTARFPYGDKTPEQLEHFALEVAGRLLAEGAKLLIVACNSATSAGLAALQEWVTPEYGVEVLGVVTPEAQQAAVHTHNGRIGLLATPATVASGAYERALCANDALIHLESVACPDLAPIIQGGFPFDQTVVDTVREYCAPLKRAAVDTVILGCTHYPLIAPMLQRMLGPDVRLITPGAAMARRTENILALRDLATENVGEGLYRFLCTTDAATFRTLGTRFLQMPLTDVTAIDLTPIAI